MKSRTLSIGLTGTIGSGKSLISKVFSLLNVPIYNADSRAKALYEDKELLNKLQSIFGNNILKNNQLDKQLLADIVFADKVKLNKLNNIMHPLVRKDYSTWLSNQTTSYAIMESAIIFENNLQSWFDKVILVATPIELVINRAMLRDNQTKEQILDRINNQMSEEQKRCLADYTIENDDIQLVIPQILDIDLKIKHLI